VILGIGRKVGFLSKLGKSEIDILIMKYSVSCDNRSHDLKSN